MSRFEDDGHCFVCGPNNPGGLAIQFREPATGPDVEAEVLFPDHLQGWQGTVHGGLLATVLDEAMCKAASARGLKCVTAEITVKYRNPAATGVRYQLEGTVRDIHSRMVTAESSIQDGSGRIHAQAIGKLFITKD
ncbi:MAG: PaaI family thioesterase [Holophaga sp.]|nr:PaaI family thioesterase [Holophaga sp.]